MNPEEVVHFLVCILETLEQIHKGGVLHRDLTPCSIRSCKFRFIQVTTADIIRSRFGDKFVLIDFGIAKFVHEGKT